MSSAFDPGGSLALSASCPRCGATAGARPVGARFCPRCGAALDARPNADVAARLDAIHKAEARLLPPTADVARASVDVADVSPDATAGYPTILLGYANALFTLGRRYEWGRGTHRNPAEAIRCYHKAARLGNAAAAARLSATAAPRQVLPAETEPSAAAAEV